jgi:HEAT repeat protein
MLKALLLPVLMVVSFLAVKLKQRTKHIMARRTHSRTPRPANLIAALSHPNWRIRLHAVQTLGQIQDINLLPHFLAALSDKDHDVRVAAQQALERIGPAAYPGLAEIVVSGSVESRQCAVETLGRLGGKEALPPLLSGLKDISMWVRAPAARALGELGHAEAVPHLIEVLRDQDRQVRQCAADALTRIGTPDALQALKDFSASN